MPLFLERAEKRICSICGEHKPVLQIPFTDKRGILDDSVKLYLCNNCLRKALIYDVLIHNNGSFGVKFRDIRGEYENMDYAEIKEIVEESSWGRVKESSNNSKVVKVSSWDSFENMDCSA